MALTGQSSFIPSSPKCEKLASKSQRKSLQLSVAWNVETEIGRKHLWEVITASPLVYWLSFLGSISKINCLSNISDKTTPHLSCTEVFLLQQTTVSLKPLTQQSRLQATGNVAIWPEWADENCHGDRHGLEGQQESGLLTCVIQAKETPSAVSTSNPELQHILHKGIHCTGKGCTWKASYISLPCQIVWSFVKYLHVAFLVRTYPAFPPLESHPASFLLSYSFPPVWAYRPWS